MNVTKSIAVVAAMLITAAGMDGIANYSNAAAAAARNGGHHATVQAIRTLPTITVRPSPQQLRELRRADPRRGATVTGTDGNRMPYYSFASDQTDA